MKLSDLSINIPDTLKGNLLLIEEPKTYEGYREGVKTGPEGLSYLCMSEGLNYDKVTVKVAGALTPAIHYEGKPIQVEFEGLDGKVWQDFRNGGQLKLSLTAKSVHVAGSEKRIKIGGDN